MTSNNITTQPPAAQPITVDLKAIIEHGDSPTALILAITIFTSIVLESLRKFALAMGQVVRPNSDRESF